MKLPPPEDIAFTTQYGTTQHRGFRLSAEWVLLREESGSDLFFGHVPTGAKSSAYSSAALKLAEDAIEAPPDTGATCSLGGQVPAAAVAWYTATRDVILSAGRAQAKADGLTLFRATVTRSASRDVWVLAKDRHAAEVQAEQSLDDNEFSDFDFVTEANAYRYTAAEASTSPPDERVVVPDYLSCGGLPLGDALALIKPEGT